MDVDFNSTNIVTQLLLLLLLISLGGFRARLNVSQRLKV